MAFFWLQTFATRNFSYCLLHGTALTQMEILRTNLHIRDAIPAEPVVVASVYAKAMGERKL